MAIEIKKENRGKFTASAKKAGMGVQEYARHILANKDDYSTTMIKRANFAKNIGGAARRRSRALGGTATYGNEYTYKYISNEEIGGGDNLRNNTLGGLGSGAAIGTMILPGIGTAIGGVLGAIGGLVGGLFGNRKRKEELAKAKETERQQTIAAMNDKIEADYTNLQNRSLNDYSEGNGFYAKYGGRFPIRYRMAKGGLIPNSSNSDVAYGATHEQFNQLTGTTGIPLGNYEVEGGGDNNGNLQAGEVITYDNLGANVFSDTLKLPNSKKTYADVAKKLTDQKGKLENATTAIAGTIEESLNEIPKNKLNRLTLGTKIRNTEKMVRALNIVSGKIAEVDDKIQNLYNKQEIHATVKGYRNNENIAAKYGGRCRRDMGGWMAGFGLLTNLMNSLSTANAIDYESKIPLPRQNRVNTPVYSTNYNINSQLQEIDSQISSAKRYITANSSNPQIARAAIGELSANASRLKNQVYADRNRVLAQMYDRNVEARSNTERINNQIDYENAVNEYNKLVDINSKRAANRQQLMQGISNGIQDYANWKIQFGNMALTSLGLPKGVGRQMNGIMNRLYGINFSIDN